MVGRGRRPTNQRPKGGGPPIRPEGARGGQYWPPSKQQVELEEKALKGRERDPFHIGAQKATLHRSTKFPPM